ncbi:MAG: EVE domain-containing protein [Terriglobales bacterium]
MTGQSPSPEQKKQDEWHSGVPGFHFFVDGNGGKRLDGSNLFLCLQYLPMDYLLKTEPTVYSFADLEREKTTIWDGVTNPAAVKHLREMKPGERLVIYHTGDEKSAVGTATVVSVDATDPRIPQVKIKVGKAISTPKTLAEIKARAAFAESPLVRQGRLSVVPLSAAQYAWLVGE